MPNILKNKRTIKRIRDSILFSLVLMITGCSSVSKVADSVLYFPRKITNKTTDLWNKHISGVPPNWQKELDLGKPRRPALNPGGSGEANTHGQQNQYSTHPSDILPVYQAPVPVGNMGISDTPQYGYVTSGDVRDMPSEAPAYAPPPALAPVDSGIKYTPLLPAPYSSSSDSDVYGSGQANLNNNPDDIPNMKPNGYVPNPILPWEKSKDYMGLGESNSQGYQSPYGDQASDDANIGGNPDPFEPGGFEDGFRPPSYEQLERMGGDPFAPVQNKYVPVFEPMAAEYRMDGSEAVEIKSEESSFIPVPLKKKSSRDKSRILSRGNSMFPLEEYAPKSDAAINNFFDSTPKKNVGVFSSKDKVNEKIDELIVKLSEKGAVVSNAENDQQVESEDKILELPKVNKVDLVKDAPKRRLPSLNGNILNKELVSDNSTQNLEEENIGLKTLEKSKVKLSSLPPKPRMSPLEKEGYSLARLPVELGRVNKISPTKISPPTLEVPQISSVRKSPPSFDDVISQVGLIKKANQEEVEEQKSEVVIMTPANSEYISPPVVNITRQFRELRKVNGGSGYRMLRNSRYSDRRGSSN